MTNIKIQPINSKYIESFRQAVGSVARELKYLAFTDAPSFEMSNEFVLNNIHNNMPHFVAITPEEKVIGWCDITSLNRPTMKHCGCLGIGIIKDYRKQGIGKQLLTTALNKAKQISLTRIELTVRENNLPAISLYGNLGFKKEGMHINAILINNKYENQISMALIL